MTIQAIRPASAFVKLGIAQGDITPPVGIYHRMWGAARHEQSEGIHRPLAAHALWMEPWNGTESAAERPNTEAAQPPEVLVLITLDHCLLVPPVTQRFIDCVVHQTGVRPQSVVISFTHTHAAGLMNPDRASCAGGEAIEPYLEQLEDLVGQLAREARDTATGTSLVAGRARCPLAAHRDYYDAATQQQVCGFNPEGSADDTVLVIRASRESPRSAAPDPQSSDVVWLVNYACHPTTLAWDNRLISPDFPGALRELLESATGVPCVFLQGASGDLGPRHGFVGDPRVADRNGRQLGYSVLSLRENLPRADEEFRYVGPVISGATIGNWQFQTRRFPQNPQPLATWRYRHWTCPLPYRDELPRLEELQQRRQQLLDEIGATEPLPGEQRVADCRALIERCDRQISRLQFLPQPVYPFEITVCQTGDIAWVFVQGEPYQQLQVELRKRFPQRAILVTTLVNAWGASYLPPQETYGSGVYQESVAVLAPGALEKITEEIASLLGEWEAHERPQEQAATGEDRTEISLVW